MKYCHFSIKKVGRVTFGNGNVLKLDLGQNILGYQGYVQAL